MSFMYVYSAWLRNINGVSLIMLIMLEIDYNNENTVKSKDRHLSDTNLVFNYKIGILSNTLMISLSWFQGISFSVVQHLGWSY